MTKVLTLNSTFRNFTNMEKTGYMVSSNSEKWPIKSETFQDQSVFTRHCEQSEQGFLWIVRMTGAWCRLVSWHRRHNIPRLGAWEPALNLGKSWEWGAVSPVCGYSRYRPRLSVSHQESQLSPALSNADPGPGKGWERRWDNNHKKYQSNGDKNISKAFNGVSFHFNLLDYIDNVFLLRKTRVH